MLSTTHPPSLSRIAALTLVGAVIGGYAMGTYWRPPLGRFLSTVTVTAPGKPLPESYLVLPLLPISVGDANHVERLASLGITLALTRADDLGILQAKEPELIDAIIRTVHDIPAAELVTAADIERLRSRLAATLAVVAAPVREFEVLVRDLEVR